MIGIGDGATVGHSASGQSEESAIQFRYKADCSIRANAVVSELSRSLLEFKNSRAYNISYMYTTTVPVSRV